MKPVFLRVENFMCHEKSEIDFTGFTSALIVGRLDGNDLYSNGVGKSTLFKAIEFVLFNESKGLKLERLIRDTEQKCRVLFDFESNNTMYRICRVRTRKGANDLALYERTSYTDNNVNPHSVLPENKDSKLFWNDISGRRAQDTEEDLQKIHKTNFQGFISAFHFAQDDYNSGLATATASNRKKILKESLQLAIYTKLHKMAQEKSKLIYTELEKKKAVWSSIGKPEEDIISLEKNLLELKPLIEAKELDLEQKTFVFDQEKECLVKIESDYSGVINKVNELTRKRKDVSVKIKQNESSIIEFSSKKKIVIGLAKSLKEEISSLKTIQADLASLDFSKINELKDNLEVKKSQISHNTAIISSLNDSLSELRIPMPKMGYCKHCRQPLSDEHRLECEKSAAEEIREKENKIRTLKSENDVISNQIKSISSDIKKSELSLSQLNNVGLEIKSKERELSDKKSMFEEYGSFVEKFKKDLENNTIELEQLDAEFKNYGEDEVESIKSKISFQKGKVQSIDADIKSMQKDLSSLLHQKAIFEHKIIDKNKDINRKCVLLEEISSLENEYSIIPDIVESFGPTGIPNLIIQNVLDDLQNEANGILEQIKPGLQLNFSVQKTKNDGEIDDDLDIEYLLNGKQRDYAQLSGAQKLSVMFSLKIGIAFLLSRTIGVNVGFLLLDEIDQALDKASVDAFAEIIRHFQKNFKILVITHNDRLKDKFSNYILVEQDLNGTSSAKVINHLIG